MTQTMFLANCRAILVAVIAYCAGRGWLTPADSGFLTALLVPIGAMIGPFAWVIYANINSKLVPHDSVAISSDHVVTVVNPPGGTALVQGADGNTVTAKVVGCLLAAFVLSFLLAGSPALAAQKFTPTGDIARGVQAATAPQSSTAAQTAREKLGCDPLNLKPGCKTAKATDDIKSLSDAMSPEMKDFVTFVQGDIGTAMKLTGQIADLPDGNGQACFSQLRKSADIITSLQQTVDSGGVIGAITAYEALRLLHMNVIKTCENTACTQIFSEVTNVVTSATPAPFSLQVPSVTKLCAKIPSIAMKPVTAP